ncbi:hypothetical protein E3P77_03384 [Wallemia ichthyophaga]|uniref:2-hydroxy-6-oxononadienedioate/2-hydroxy-6-oxononatrienedioate hydrolase n=1 Tax=Wallemia ichthyophaga (strain EXF-994 / CBS 113033) TaxID=1299270 RepID=R9ABS1_WALI9|nr:2-hydroxy-6-oxononadienedioate/2-hydroxy-6-oxononatrienedioate hydrolase [Wallemia ichthyophaga EXF-994]EOQ99524.1 2-hydroxy-6-oxononadienedioate/2-hydroxy-6-oxononatrienedioate hydrolase [Wallemia ichthyophaga EXF-994]TIB30804.1 hypothetical protein E3P84_03212 [Wallemia ichthyophaga]TIB63836.1 hypothetical protein E3P77_03384 [Wallemia ichthyophaga]
MTTITIQNKHLALGAASLLLSFHLYRLVGGLFANTPPPAPSHGYSVRVERGLGGIERDSDTARAVDEVYPPDAFPGGGDVRLPHGRIKYYILGPQEGEKIVLVHGFSSPCIIWRELAVSLAGAGYRVLMYDHYGRGYSDHPIVEYSGALYTCTLALLMHHVGFARATLCGLSMGGPIVVNFADVFPDMVNSIILLAPAGLMDDAPFTTARSIDPKSFIEAPHWLRRILKPSGPANYNASEMPDNLRMLAKMSAIQGQRTPFVHALLSTLREGILFNQDEVFKAVGRRGRRVHIVWGTADNIVPYSLSKRMLEYMPQASLDTIVDGGHDLAITNADHVHRSIVAFMKEQS